MKIITVVVQVRNSQSEFRDPRLAFWSAVAEQRNSLVSSNRETIDDIAARYEQLIRNELPKWLFDRMSQALFSDRTENLRGLGATARPLAVQPSRLITSVQAIRYGSMSIDLGLPDLDAFVEVLGNNSGVFEAIFGAYIPDALSNTLRGEFEQFQYTVSIPKETRDYIDSTPHKEATSKEKGTALLASFVRSPLILPILLICFLWYYARQDMVEERRITSGLIQTLVTEQTVVLGLLKNKQDTELKSCTATGRSSAAQPAPTSKAQEGAK